MTRQTRKMKSARTMRIAAAAVLVLGASGVSGMPRAGAESTDVCALANQRLAETGKGDNDHDGLSNCEEKKVLATDPRDYDSDDDSLADGDEIADGTDPTDSDSDDDGLDDGDEDAIGTDPKDSDSDDDGEDDGDDDDPAAELEDQVSGAAQSATCLSDGTGTLTVLGIPIVLEAGTEYEGIAGCDALAARIASGVTARVEVEVTGDAATALVAHEVSIEDGDNDGRPDDADDDDDGDGTPDDDDDDDEDEEDDDGQD